MADDGFGFLNMPIEGSGIAHRRSRLNAVGLPRGKVPGTGSTAALALPTGLPRRRAIPFSAAQQIEDPPSHRAGFTAAAGRSFPQSVTAVCPAAVGPPSPGRIVLAPHVASSVTRRSAGLSSCRSLRNDNRLWAFKYPTLHLPLFSWDCFGPRICAVAEPVQPVPDLF